MIIADLDGTLIKNSHVSEETMRAIKRLQEDGYVFTVATGRHVTAATSLIDQLQIEFPVLCSNGAYVGVPSKNKIIKEICIDETSVLDAVDMINRFGSDFLLYTTKRIVATKQAKEKLESRIGSIPAHVIDLNEIPDFISEGIVKLLIIETDPSKFQQMYRHFKDNKELSIVSSNKDFLDIGSQHSSKGNGLKELCKYLGIGLDEVIAVGDQENDISMLQVAGVGIAMGNASDTVKQAANFVTKSIDENGFSVAVERFLYHAQGKED
ncbi:MAG: HAD family phosphatase [Bacilli bacterium]|nr:HAD family phosphatase [Bacilli bacterium]